VHDNLIVFLLALLLVALLLLLLALLLLLLLGLLLLVLLVGLDRDGQHIFVHRDLDLIFLDAGD
jgi:hypothetical protein